MVPPDVAKAGWGRGILNTIILNHKENSTKLSSYANKPPSTSPERVVSARRPVAGVLCQRVRHLCTTSRCQSVPCRRARHLCLAAWGAHESPIAYSLLRGGFHPPHPLTAERGGAVFGACCWGWGIWLRGQVDLGQGGDSGV